MKQRITLTNKHHKTSIIYLLDVSLDPVTGERRVEFTKEMVRLCRQHLCGSSRCKCGGVLGQTDIDGHLVIERNDRGAWVYLR